MTGLGSAGLLRIGGNTYDHATWSPTGAADSDFTPARFDTLMAFSAAVGWPFTFGLNLGTFDPDTAAAEAAALASRPNASQLRGLEIGNEPDLYSANGHRSPAYAPDSAVAEYHAYLLAIERRTNVGLAGCACAFNLAYLSAILDADAPRLALATQHFYPMINGPSIGAGSAQDPTIGNMLSAALMARTASYARAVADAANAAHIAIRMGETNNCAGGGKPGVSDVYASALWAVDHAYTLAEAGIAGINFHGFLTGKGYSPISDSAGVALAKPEYYGLLAFAAGASGQLLPVHITGTPPNMAAHATLGGDGVVRVTIVNKDSVASVFAHIVPSRAMSRATALRLLGASLGASAGVTFAGRTVGPDGTFTPGTAESVPVDSTGFGITVPAASAAVVTLTL